MQIRKLFFEDVRSKFLLVGFLNTIVGSVIFTGLYFILKEQISYLLILLISQIFAVLFSHSTQRTLVWKSTESFLPEFFRFSASYAVIGIVNIVLLRIAVDSMNYPVLISQFAIGIILILTNYIVQKNLIFR